MVILQRGLREDLCGHAVLKIYLPRREEGGTVADVAFDFTPSTCTETVWAPGRPRVWKEENISMNTTWRDTVKGYRDCFFIVVKTKREERGSYPRRNSLSTSAKKTKFGFGLQCPRSFTHFEVWRCTCTFFSRVEST